MDQNIKAGDYLIDFEVIYQVTSIDNRKLGDKDETFISYKPVLGTDKIFEASIPAKNLPKTGMRQVFTEKEAEEAMLALKLKQADFDYNGLTVKEDIYLNEPHKVAKIIKYLWDNSSGLSKADLVLRDELIEHLSMEIAFVTKKTQNQAKEEITANLGG